MTGMEHAIEQAAKAIWDAQADGLAKPRDLAEALAEAGLLAPSTLREEWGLRWADGTAWDEGYRSRADVDVDFAPGDTLLCRWVTDWEES